MRVEESGDEAKKNWEAKHEGEDRMTSKVWSSSVMIEGGMVANFVNAASMPAARGNLQLLIQASALINGLLEKLYYSIQKN